VVLQPQEWAAWIYLTKPEAELLQPLPAGSLVVETVHSGVTRCLIPDFDGAIFSATWKEAPWDKFFTDAPQRRRQSVERYNIVKRA
jgi:hypothetical protein